LSFYKSTTYECCTLFVRKTPMQKDRNEEQLKLLELNQRFLAEVENGAGWKELKAILDDMKEVAKNLDQVPATVISFDNYPLTKTSESGI
jgi:hypothetical protein